jgi:hypothetical protein
MKNIFFVLLLFISGTLKAQVVYLECRTMSKTSDHSNTYIINFSDSTITNTYNSHTHKAQITPGEIRWTTNLDDNILENNINRYSGVYNRRYIQGGIGTPIPSKCEIRKDRKF